MTNFFGKPHRQLGQHLNACGISYKSFQEIFLSSACYGQSVFEQNQDYISMRKSSLHNKKISQFNYSGLEILLCYKILILVGFKLSKLYFLKLLKLFLAHSFLGEKDVNLA